MIRPKRWEERSTINKRPGRESYSKRIAANGPKRINTLILGRSAKGETLAVEAAKYVIETLPNVRSVGQVASALSVSREHVSRSFKRHLGCSLWSFVTELRVERAQKLLRGPMLVKEISKEVGFGSDSSFLRAFVRHCGTLPREYRKRAQQEALANSGHHYATSNVEPQASHGE